MPLDGPEKGGLTDSSFSGLFSGCCDGLQSQSEVSHEKELMAPLVSNLRAGGLSVFTLGCKPYCFQIDALCIYLWPCPRSCQKHYSPDDAPDADPPDRMKGKMSD